ncbi:MAG: hypothetical protein AABW84_02490 [Nanoarchaeota archaeon]
MAIVNAKEFLLQIGKPIEHTAPEELEKLLASEVIAFADEEDQIHLWNSEEYYVLCLITNNHIQNNPKKYRWGVLPSPIENTSRLRREYKSPSKLGISQNVFVVDPLFIGYVHKEHLQDILIGEANEKAQSSVMYNGKYMTDKDKQLMVNPFYDST